MTKQIPLSKPRRRNSRNTGLGALVDDEDDAPDGAEIDHINGRGLDNRRGNLRFATRQQGLANRVVFKRSKSGFI